MLLILSSSSLLASFYAPKIRIASNHLGTPSVKSDQTQKPSFLIPHNTCDPITEGELGVKQSLKQRSKEAKGLNQGPVVGTTSVNLAEFISDAEQKELQLNIPLTSCGAAAEPCPSLCVRS